MDFKTKIKSTVATGTAPFDIASTTSVTNLNVDLLDGKHASDFALASQVLTNVPSGAKFTDTVYTHPENHPASMITESSTKRFVSDSEKSTWNGKQNALGYTPANETGVIDTGSTSDGTAFSIEETDSSKRAAIFLKRSGGKRAGFFWYGNNHPSGYSGKFRIHLDDKSDVLFTNVNDMLVDGKKVYHEGNLGNVTNDKQMPISNGVLENYREKLTTVSASDGTINLSLGNVFQHSPSGNITYSITNAVSGEAHSFTLIINQTATVRTLTFPASVKWQGGEIPDLSTANKTYVLTFMTVDGGTNWLGMFGGEF